MKQFDYSLDFKNIDFRQHPHLYRVGKGEQGVLLVEPYKGEILPHWRLKSEEIARESSEKIYAMFLSYREQDDFVGMDMARKFLQMGYTRARRYANHRSGKKVRRERTGTPAGGRHPGRREGPRRPRLLREVRAGQRRRALQAAQEGVDRAVRLG